MVVKPCTGLSGNSKSFGPGKYAEHVMSYIMQEVEKRGWQDKANMADR